MPPSTPFPNANQLLGYPADARLLMLTADDFGMCHANNAATLQALQHGIVTSTSLMAPCPWAPHAIELLRAHPQIPFGVHLTLMSEHSPYRWGPLASKNAVPSLIDEHGYFFSEARRHEFLTQAVITEVETEFRAQIDTILASGLQPTHLDFHCLADGGRDDIFTLVLDLAQEYRLALRSHSPAATNQCRQAGIPTSDHEILDSYLLGADNKPAQFATLLRDLPPGLTEWAVHPGLGDAEAQAMEPDGWRVRRSDFDFVISPEARDLLAAENITLISNATLYQHIPR